MLPPTMSPTTSRPREVVFQIGKLIPYLGKGDQERVAERCSSSPDGRQGSMPAAAILLRGVKCYRLCCSDNRVHNPFFGHQRTQAGTWPVRTFVGIGCGLLLPIVGLL